MKDKVRPLYSRLQGLLNQAPQLKESDTWIPSVPLCDYANTTIDQLGAITNNDYSLHKFGNEITSWNSKSRIDLSAYKGKLGSIIAELHGTYFSDEPAPFSGMPNTVINQSANQNTNVQITMLLEMQSQIDRALSKVTNENDRGFLEKVKSQLSSVSNIVELFSLMLATAQKFGISMEKLIDLIT